MKALITKIFLSLVAITFIAGCGSQLEEKGSKEYIKEIVDKQNNQ